MLNNDKLLRRIKKIVKYLKERWGITPYRIALESNIPHSSLKYMMDGKFEWKLNHLLSIVDFLNRNNTKISLTDLLDFESKKTLAQIMNTEKADFRQVLYGDIEALKTKVAPEIKKRVDAKKKSEILANDLTEIIKEHPLFKNHRISIDLKISDKNFDFKKDLRFENGKKLKD
jgi:hypothetical protein